MDKFNGFSQDEINKVSGAKNKKVTGLATDAMKQAFRKGTHVGIRRQMPDKWSRPTTTAKQQQVSGRSSAATMATSDTGAATGSTRSKTPTVADTASEEETMDDVILDRSMSKSIEEALFYQPMKSKAPVQSDAVAAATTNGDTSSSSNEAGNNSSILQLPPNMVGHVTSTSMEDSSILHTIQQRQAHAPAGGAVGADDELNVDSPFKGISLKDFEAHRKMIQEQNKQKKELLYKAIEHHSQKTAAETRKIQEIKSELAKLDNDLAVDVSMLRKQIDNACIHFASVEKQYMKVEAQFLKIKIDLHNAAEKKELLTEHLCTVIAHNEDRKAQKLSELMEKVGLTPTGEYDLAPVVDK